MVDILEMRNRLERQLNVRLLFNCNHYLSLQIFYIKHDFNNPIKLHVSYLQVVVPITEFSFKSRGSIILLSCDVAGS